MKNRISVYVGPPLARILEDEKNVSGRLNAIADRYYRVIKKCQPDLVEEDVFILKNVCLGSHIDDIFIDNLQHGIRDYSEAPEVQKLAKLFESKSFVEKLAAVEMAGF